MAMKPEKQESGTNFTDSLDFFSACGNGELSL